MKWLHRYTKLVVAATVLLIAAGGMVTSTGSGLSVPDWPTTYGWSMFSFPFNKWVGGIFYEHGHRLIASTVGFLTIILAVWTWRVDPRAWVRRLGFAALGAVVLQGLLGGITVLLFLPPAVSIGHAGLAQLFFCITLSLALFTSRGWREAPVLADDPRLRTVAAATTGLIYVQILSVRRCGIPGPDWRFRRSRWRSAMSCRRPGLRRLRSTSPTAPARSSSSPRFSRPRFTCIGRTRAERAGPAGGAPRAARFTQATLGAFVVMSGLQPFIDTLHVVNGALVLGTSLVLTLRACRPMIEARRVSARDSARSAVLPVARQEFGVHGSTRGREARP